MVAFLIVDADRNFRDALAIGLRLDGHLAVATDDVDEAYARRRAGGRPRGSSRSGPPGADALLELAAGAGLQAIATSPYPELLSAAASRRPRAEALAKPFGSKDLLARARRHASAA